MIPIPDPRIVVAYFLAENAFANLMGVNGTGSYVESCEKADIVSAMTQLGNTRALGLIKIGIKSKNPQVRMAALQTLAAIVNHWLGGCHSCGIDGEMLEEVLAYAGLPSLQENAALIGFVENAVDNGDVSTLRDLLTGRGGHVQVREAALDSRQKGNAFNPGGYL